MSPGMALDLGVSKGKGVRVIFQAVVNQPITAEEDTVQLILCDLLFSDQIGFLIS